MKFGKRDKSIIDALFLLALFGVFLICALFIVLFGAKIYKNTVNNSDISFNSRTALSYVTEKVRQNDNYHGIAVINSGDDPVVMLSQTVNDRVFCTYLYKYEGSLMEYTTNEGNILKKDFGSKIMDITDFSVKEINKGLYNFIISDVNGHVTDFYVSIYSDDVDNDLAMSLTKGKSKSDSIGKGGTDEN